jgi:NADPH2:quinone reductase
MHAAWFDRFGPAEEVLQTGTRDQPRPGEGEVLVRMRSSGVNPSDVKKRAGSIPGILDGGYIIPNSDGAGIIEAVGNGVADSRIGQRVWVYQAQYARRFGTAAEYLAIDSTRAPELPEQASFAEGACLGIPAMTAYRCVFADGDVTGQTVLVTGGAGRVGHYAIQWASQAGARVIATASNDEDSASCRDAGAEAVVNHRETSWAQSVLEATGGAKIDRVVDVEFGANLEEVLEVIRIGGVIATYSSTVVPEPKLPFFRMMYQDLTVRIVIVYAMPEAAKRAAVQAITEALTGQSLLHRIAHRVPLDEIARANQLIEGGGVRGAVVLDIV